MTEKYDNKTSSTVLATNLFGILGEIIEWRFIILGIAAFAGGVLAISFFALSLHKEEDIKESHISERESSHGFWSDFRLWLLALVWALVNAQLLSYVTFGPQYFQTFGMTIQRAGLLTSFIMLIPIFLSPVVGIIIDKTGWKKPLFLIGSMIMAISFILIGRTTLTHLYGQLD
ncbi:MAG: MFS transporter [Clostridiales bacterium]|nr:MFS transporter [Clostridiales bacterium]